MKKIPVGRAIMAVIAMGFLVVGAKLFFDAHRLHQEYLLHEGAHLLDFEVDFSKPGVIVKEFQQEWAPPHGQWLSLYPAPDGSPAISAKELYDTVMLDWQVTDAAGKVVDESELMQCPRCEEGNHGEAICLGYISVRCPGTYTFKLNITRGDARLADRPQRIVSGYLMCGLEMLQVAIEKVLGGAAVLIGLILVLVILIITKRREIRWKAETPPNN